MRRSLDDDDVKAALAEDLQKLQELSLTGDGHLDVTELQELDWRPELDGEVTFDFTGGKEAAKRDSHTDGGDGSDTEGELYVQRGPQGNLNMKGSGHYAGKHMRGKSVFDMKKAASQREEHEAEDDTVAQVAVKPPPRSNPRVTHTPLTPKLLCMCCLEYAHVDKRWLQLSEYFLTRESVPSYKEDVMIPGTVTSTNIDAFDFFINLHTELISESVRVQSYHSVYLNTDVANEQHLLIEIAFAVVMPCLYMELKKRNSELKKTDLRNVRDKLSRLFSRKGVSSGTLLHGRFIKGDASTTFQRLHAIAQADCAKLTELHSTVSHIIIGEMCNVLRMSDTVKSDNIHKLFTMSASVISKTKGLSLKWQDIVLSEILYADIMLFCESVSKTPRYNTLLKTILTENYIFNTNWLFEFTTHSIETKSVLIDIVQDFHIALKANIDYDHIIVIRQPKPNTPPGSVIAAGHPGAATGFQKLPVTMLRLRIT